MKKVWCWLVTGALLLSPTLAAYADVNPRIITVAGSSQAGTAYYTDFGSNSFLTNTCQNPTQIQGIQAWGGTNYIRLGDFNGNGRLDIASPHGPWVLIKTTDPDFFPFNYSYCLQHLGPTGVSNEWGAAEYTWVGDFNGDGKDDIGSGSGGYVYMKLSNPGSGFTGFHSEAWSITIVPIPLQPWTGPLWGGSDYTWVGDFNGDNIDDIASAIGGSVRVHLSNGSEFRSETWNVANQWASGAWTRVGDFNGDGKDDIASASGGTVYMKRSTGGGFISESWSVANTWGSAAYTWVADFNRDGCSDFASADAGNVRMKLSQETHFSSQDWPVTNQWGGPQYTWVMDYDSDGYKDIVSAYDPYTLVTKRNTGTGFSSASWNYFGWWGPAVNTWALDHSRFSFLN
jgi:hypothetical protein